METTGTNQIKGFCDKIIMDQKMVAVISAVTDLICSKWYIPDHAVKKAVRVICFRYFIFPEKRQDFHRGTGLDKSEGNCRRIFGQCVFCRSSGNGAWRVYNGEYPVWKAGSNRRPKDGITLEEQLKEAVKHIHGTITELELSDTELEEDVASIPADPEVRISALRWSMRKCITGKTL